MDPLPSTATRPLTTTRVIIAPSESRERSFPAQTLNDIARVESIPFSSQDAVNQGSTVYMLVGSGVASATEVDGAFLFNRKGIIRDLYVLAAANTLDVATTFTVRKNGTATTLTLSLATTVTSGNERKPSLAFTVEPGDYITVQLVTAAGTGAITDVKATLSFEATL